MFNTIIMIVLRMSSLIPIKEDKLKICEFKNDITIFLL